MQSLAFYGRICQLLPLLTNFQLESFACHSTEFWDYFFKKRDANALRLKSRTSYCILRDFASTLVSAKYHISRRAYMDCNSNR